MRRVCSALVVLLFALLAACGSGSSGGTSGAHGGQATSTPGGPTKTKRPTITPGGPTLTPRSTVTPGGPTKTPRPTVTPGGPTKTRRPTITPGGPTLTPSLTPTPGPPQVLYVRANGNDSNSGTAPDQALRSIAQAATMLKPNVTVYVGPGHYNGRVSVTGVGGTAAAPVALRADPSGAHTGDRPGDVILDAAGDTVALIITKATYLTVDGFFIVGPVPQTTPQPVSATGVEVRSTSAHATISNCVIANASTADGIRVDTSTNVLIYNNLIYASDRGVTLTGDTSDAFVVNNTIASSERTGILVKQKGGVAPSGVMIMNNVIQENANHIGIDIDQGPPSSQTGYVGDYNLVFEPDAADQSADYRPPEVHGHMDINADARFVNLPQGDVHLGAGSPAIDQGTDHIDSELLNPLLLRSTSPSGGRDQAPVDMGYHYPR